MSHADDPDRLLIRDGTPLERRLVGAIADERMPAEVGDRIARAIGVSLGAAAASTAAAAIESASVAAKAATAGAGTSLPFGWISAGLAGLLVTGAFVGGYVWKSSPPASSPTHGAAPAPRVEPPPQPALPEPPTLAPTAFLEGAPAPQRRSQARPTANALRDEIARVDAARAALAASSGARALGILRQYREAYPSGALRPEAAALQVEALAALGRMAEARTLARRFQDEYGASPQTDRVLELAGLRPAAASSRR